MSFPPSTCVESFNVYGMEQVTFKIIPGVSLVSFRFVFVFRSFCMLYVHILPPSSCPSRASGIAGDCRWQGFPCAQKGFFEAFRLNFLNRSFFEMFVFCFWFCCCRRCCYIPSTFFRGCFGDEVPFACAILIARHERRDHGRLPIFYFAFLTLFFVRACCPPCLSRASR